MKLAESKYVEGVQIIPHHLSETFLLSLLKKIATQRVDDKVIKKMSW